MQTALRQNILDKLANSTFELALKATLAPEKALDGTPAFTRSSTAYVLGYPEAANSGAGQVLLNIPAGIARFHGARFIASNNTWSSVFADGTPIPEGTLKGAFIEGARTNIMLQSETLDTTWTQTSVTVAPDAIAAPNGTLTADKILDTVSIDTSHDVRMAITCTADPYTFSFYAKAGTKSWIKAYNGKGVTYFNLTTGVIGTNGNTYATIEALADGWFRCSITNTYTATAQTHLIGMASADNLSNYVGDGTGYFYLWGAQVEIGNYASSYIPTTVAAVSRAPDILAYPSANLIAESGALEFQVTLNHAPSGTIFLAGSYIDANNAIVILHDSAKLIARKRIAGVNYDAMLAKAFVAGTRYKIAMSWGTKGLYIAMAGLLGPNSNSTALPLGATIQIGADGNGAAQAFGGINNIKFYPKQVERSKLARLTLTS